MILFSAHIGYLFGELPLADRIAAAARCGFTAIEHPQPFTIPAGNLRHLAEDNGLSFIQLAGAVGDGSRGEKGLACLPGREADFRREFDEALDYAVAAGARLIHPMSGVADPSQDTQSIAETYRNNIGYAVERARGSGVGILIEAISEGTVPGYYISTLDAACAVQDCFGRDNVSLLVDTFHAAVTGVDVPQWIGMNADRIGHIHIADYPGRHEPGTGSIDFASILQALFSARFDKAIGFEYVPSATTPETLAFLPGWKESAAQPDPRSSAS